MGSISDMQTTKRIKTQPYESVLNILLIDGNNFDFETDYFVRFKLANEKAKSRTISKNNKKPTWIEQFDLNIFVGQSRMLEICVCASNHSLNECYFKFRIDLSEITTDKTQRFLRTFGSTSLNFLLTISGSCLNALSNRDLSEIHHEMVSFQNVFLFFFITLIYSRNVREVFVTCPALEILF